VAAAAVSTAQETSRAASVVATAVAAAAAHMARMASAAEDSYEAEVASAAEAMLYLTTQTATRVATETEDRAVGVAQAARIAAAAAYVSFSVREVEDVHAVSEVSGDEPESRHGLRSV
jgi:hypothetical protein